MPLNKETVTIKRIKNVPIFLGENFRVLNQMKHFSLFYK